MRLGLPPPLCGSHGNVYKDSCGAFIRSEIWACIAPGNPRLAARYAYEDAILDHGDGEGVYAEIFCAAMESAAFVCSDLRELIEIGLAYIPAESGCAGAVRLAMEAYDSGKTWLEARDLMLEKFRGGTFFGFDDMTSPRDHTKGFVDGKRGWDAPDNLGITAIGLLYGEGDFGKTICTAVNCGEDTDCTAATAGALFGIIYGSEAIPENWIAPIGRTVKTACLNLGELGFYGDQLPADVDVLTDRTLKIGRQAALRGGPLALSETLPTDLSGVNLEELKPDTGTLAHFDSPRGPVYKFDFFEIALDYGLDGAAIRAGAPKTITLRIRNSYRVQAHLHLRWLAGDDWQILPARTGTVLSLPSHLGPHKEIAFHIQNDTLNGSLHRLALEIVIDSRPTTMLVPLVFVNAGME